MNPPYRRSTVASLALKFAPPRIRESLLDDESFRNEYGFKTEAWIAFGPSGVSLQRSKFFNAIRSILPTKAIAEVADSEGRIWNLANEADDGRLPNLVLLSGQQRIILPDFSVLSTEVTTRIRFLDEFAVDVNLPSVTYERWKNILLARPLEDEDVDTFYSDIHDTPKYFERLLQNEILSGKCNLSSLVPRSRRYYERLVGIYDGSSRIQEYAAGIGRDFFKQLIDWDPYDGFLLSLLLSSHSAMTAEINANHIDSKHIEEALGYLEKHGDMLSRLGAIEVGVCILPNRPEIEPPLLRLLQQIRDDDVSGKASEFRLFSALFILVDGELARTRLSSGMKLGNSLCYVCSKIFLVFF